MKISKPNDSIHATPFDELNQRIDGTVHTEPLYRYLLSTDGSIFQVQPVAVVYPKTGEDVSATIDFACRQGITVHGRGAGSGLCGAALGAGIVLDFTRFMNRLVHLDPDERTFECEPGYRFGELEAKLGGSGLFFPPDPSSGEYATFGGMFGTNASGAHSVKYGNTADYVLDADVVTGSAETIRLSEIRSCSPSRLPAYLQQLSRLYHDHREQIENAYPPIRYNSSGYNLRGLVHDDQLDLRRLFAGSEGTLGITTRLKFRLIDKPTHDSLVVAFFKDIRTASLAVQQVLPMDPSGIEIMDKSLLTFARMSEKLPAGIDNVLLIEFDAFESAACRQLAETVRDMLLREGFTDQAHLAVSAGEKAKFWELRKAAVPTLYKLKGRKRILALIEDAAVPIEHLHTYVDRLYQILERNRVDFVLFGHIAKGLLHTRPLLDLKDPADLEKLKILTDQVFELVHSLGGAISGEHGDGRIRSAYLRRQYPDIYALFTRTRQLFDPDGILNPEIIAADDPHQMQRHLRFGADYRQAEIGPNRLRWPEGFADEVERCHGCSKCTTVTLATRMCPIFKFTRDETASPKAKANVLRALISGSIEGRALYEKLFQQVITHCVNCGSCYTECPSNVNIPKMALEARARYVARFGSSIEDHLLANVELAGRGTRKFAGLLAPVARSQTARRILEKTTGISARRDPVIFPFRSLFERVPATSPAGAGQVIYFAGCYAGYIRPEIGEAAVKVLNHLGLTVFTPPQHCCGLPMISKGMADRAADRVAANLGKWGEMLARADQIVVTCSSCGLALMQEWAYLVDADTAARVREKVIHISRLVLRHAPKPTCRSTDIHLAYHYPCHLRVQPDADCSVQMLSEIGGLRVDALHTHCCGMAGSWGMAARHFDLSEAISGDLIGQLNTSGAAYGVTDCPTCRMQMEQLSNKAVRHPIEILADRIME
ncbi:MAG: oxidoreductase [Deltaproteobacteria bacterium SG8_13]|nr:MAG: oxidoreductase [Deltaproteobacteria bacterium SG8_13]